MNLEISRQKSENEQKYEQLVEKLKQMQNDFAPRDEVHELINIKCEEVMQKIAPKDELHQLHMDTNLKNEQPETELKIEQKKFNTAPRDAHHQLDESSEHLETESKPVIIYCAPRDVLHYL